MPHKPTISCEQTRRGLIAATVGLQAVVLGLALLFTYDELLRTVTSMAGTLEPTPVGEPGTASSSLPAASNLASRLTAMAALAGGVVIGITTLGLALIVRRYDNAVAAHSRELEAELEAKLSQELSARHALIFGLAKLADYRDTDTGTHLDRIAAYSAMLAEEVRPFFPEIDDEWIERLRLASSLHDIGKVGIPDEILLKPGRLTPEERTVMETHAAIGGETLAAVRGRFGEDPLIDMAIAIAMEHHEKWDGSGYPNRLAGERITLSARIVALADFYDAITSERVYKAAMTHEEARELIRQGRGTHFEPVIADAFERRQDEFDRVRRRLQTITLERGRTSRRQALAAA